MNIKQVLPVLILGMSSFLSIEALAAGATYSYTQSRDASREYYCNPVHSGRYYNKVCYSGAVPVVVDATGNVIQGAGHATVDLVTGVVQLPVKIVHAVVK